MKHIRRQPPQGVITGPKDRAGCCRLARGAPSGQFSHDEAQVERGDAAEVAFVVIDEAPQGGASQPAAVGDVGEPPLNLFPTLFKQGFAAFAFHGAGRFDHGPPGFGPEVGRLPAIGIGVADDGAKARRLLNDAQLPGTVKSMAASTSLSLA